MMIRSATALRNDYDGMVKLSTEKQEPIYLTRSGDGEMVFLPIALWEKRQAELELFADMLRREQTKLSGARTYATRAIESGMQPKVLQKLLGHASIKTTMDRYVHVTDDSMAEAIRLFESHQSASA